MAIRVVKVSKYHWAYLPQAFIILKHYFHLFQAATSKEPRHLDFLHNQVKTRLPFFSYPCFVFDSSYHAEHIASWISWNDYAVAEKSRFHFLCMKLFSIDLFRCCWFSENYCWIYVVWCLMMPLVCSYFISGHFEISSCMMMMNACCCFATLNSALKIPMVMFVLMMLVFHSHAHLWIMVCLLFCWCLNMMMMNALLLKPSA